MKRILGILLALMLVAVCGCAKPEEEPVVEDTPVYTVREGFVTDLEDLIKLKYSNGETTISVVISDDAWFHEDDLETWLNQSIFMNIAKTAGQMAYIEEVKTVSSLADYGLEKPAYTITMENEDGFVVTLYVGNTEGEDACYVTTDDKKAVYKVSNAIIGMLEFDKEKLIAVEVDPMQYLMSIEEETIEGDDGLGVEETPTVEDTATPDTSDTVTDTEPTPDQTQDQTQQ